MNRYIIHVPRDYNNGETIPWRKHVDLVDGLTRVFGGITCIREVLGQWVDPQGEIAVDFLYLYLVDTDREDFDWQELERQIAADFQREEVYITKQVIEVL